MLPPLHHLQQEWAGQGLHMGSSGTGLCSRPCTTCSRRRRVKGCGWAGVAQGCAAWAPAARMASPSLAKTVQDTGPSSTQRRRGLSEGQRLGSSGTGLCCPGGCSTPG